MQHDIRRLDNGLETLFINSPGSTNASIQIWFRAGSALEDKGDEGIAHFLEHMFFKGTKKRPGSAIAHEVESFGGEINAFTSFDYTCYYINTPSNHLNKTVEILLDMVANPEFKKSELLPERDVVHEEYRRSQDSPNQYSFQRLQKSCFTKGYGHPILGYEKTIKNFSRTQLTKFRSKNYNRANALLIVAGDLKNKKTVEKTINKYALPTGKNTSFPSFKLKPKPQVDVHHKDVRMAQLTLTIQAPPLSDEKSVGEDLAFNCLGHGETSRLYENIVMNNSLANSSSSSTMFMAEGGVHFTRLTFPPENFDAVVKELQGSLSTVLEEGFSDQELQKIKNQYLSSKIYDKESLESYAFSLGHGFAQTGDIHSEDEFIQKASKTSLSTVNTSFQRVFSRPVHISFQLPKDQKKENFEQGLKSLATYFEKNRKAESSSKKKLKTTSSKYDPQVSIVNLREGVKLLHRQNPMTPTFVMHGYIKGGLSDENNKLNGLYHLLSSGLTYGHKNATYDELKTDMEEKSASLYGFSGKNAYGLNLHGQTEHFTNLVQHFMGSFLTPTFPDEHLDHEKHMALRSLEAQKEDPIKQCFQKNSEIVFNGHPYSMNLLGTESTVNGINRQDIINKHNDNLEKKEILFTYCGDLDLETVYEKLNESLDELSNRPTGVSSNTLTPLYGERARISFDREQTQILLSIPTPPLGHKDNIVLKMLTTHLSGQSSELFVDVRDRKGLCYSVQPIHFSALEGGYWGIYMASGHDKVDKAIDAIQEIIAKHKDKGLSAKEFARVKKMIEGQNLLNIQTNDDYANIYSIPVLHGQGVDYFYKTNEIVNKLKYEDFQKQIKHILNKKWNKVIVGKSN